MPAQAAARRLAMIAGELDPDSPSRTGGPGDRPAGHAGEAWWADHTRVAAVPAIGAEPVVRRREPPAGAPTAVPVPGRHAARRRGRAGRWVAAAGDRAPVLSPGHLAVVALAVALGLAVTTWWVVRDDPAPVAADAPAFADPLVPVGSTAEPSGSGAPASAAPSDDAEAGAGAGPGGDEVTVDVAGKVRRPGIVVLDAGSRVTDALEAAGGAKRGVDLTSLNLARVLVDGEQIVVGAAVAAAPGGGSASAAPGGPPGALVNLNLATQAELEELPQVGPVTAQAIIAWREERGGFTSVDELLEVDGIGEKSLARLAPLVTV